MANLNNLNTKNYGQMTLNTKPHSDPLISQRVQGVAQTLTTCDIF